MAATWLIATLCTTLLVSIKSTVCAVADEYNITIDGTPITPSMLLDLSSYKFLKELNALKPDVSLVCSPVNIFILLSLYSTGAPQDIQKSISDILDFGSFEKLQDIESMLGRSLSYRNKNITAGRKIYFKKGLELTKSFRKTAEDYRTSVGKLDFSNPGEAMDEVNAWADLLTEGVIKEPMIGSGIKSSTVMMMVTALFFKGHFIVPFKAKDTKDMEFHVNKNKKVTRKMMSVVQSNLHYTESTELDAKLIVIPFRDDDVFRILILLPNDVDGLTTLLNKSVEEGVLFRVLYGMMPTEHEVDILLPRFQLRTKVDAEEVIKNVGLSNYYTSPAKGIVENQDITLGRVLQEAFINIDETGATPMPRWNRVVKPPPPDRFTFHATHPFIFSVMRGNAIFYMGTYRG